MIDDHTDDVLAGEMLGSPRSRSGSRRRYAPLRRGNRPKNPVREFIERFFARPSAPDGGLSRAWVIALVGWLATYAVLGQRIYLPRGAGHAIPLANLITIVLFTGLLVRHPDVRRDAFDRLTSVPWLLTATAAWTLVAITGPIVGYPVHTVFAATVPLGIVAFVSIGSLVSASPHLPPRLPFVLVVAVGWTQFVAGLMQAFWYTSVVALPPQRWLYIWDAVATRDVGAELIAGRSSGLYLNPNPYSLLGGLLLVLAATLPLEWRERLLLGIPASGIVFLGASRSTVLALLVLAIPWLLARLRGVDKRDLAMYGGAVLGILAVLHVTLTLSGSSLYARFVGRWATIPGLLSKGASGDANVLGRFDAWAKALDYWTSHPFGSFGPPQMAISSFTDNDYVTLLLQGGLLLLLTYLGTLVNIYVRRRRSPIAASIAPLVGLMALTGLTQTSAVYVPALALFWVAAGTVVAGPRATGTADAAVTPRQVRRMDERQARRRRQGVALLSSTALTLLALAIVIRIAGPEQVISAAPDSASRPVKTAEASETLPGVHVETGDHLGPYYVDLPSSSKWNRVDDLSSPNIIAEERKWLRSQWRPPTAVVAGKDRPVPISVAIGGLRDYTRGRITGDERFFARAMKAADWLLERQGEDGSWTYPYTFHDLEPGWVSANMQSLAASLMARVYQETGDSKYRRSAVEAVDFMLKPVAEGGTRSAFRDGRPVLEGYAGSITAKHSLSGAIIGMWGVRDVAMVTGSERLSTQFSRLSSALAEHLDDYDIDGWSRYSLGTMNTASPDVQHRIFIAELRAHSELTADHRFALCANRWQRSLNEWLAEE